MLFLSLNKLTLNSFYILIFFSYKCLLIEKFNQTGPFDPSINTILHHIILIIDRTSWIWIIYNSTYTDQQRPLNSNNILWLLRLGPQVVQSNKNGVLLTPMHEKINEISKLHYAFWTRHVTYGCFTTGPVIRRDRPSNHCWGASYEKLCSPITPK